MKEFSKNHPIPLYGVWFEVVISSDFDKSRLKPSRYKRLGKLDIDLSDASGIASHFGRNFAVFFKPDALYCGVISHEAFHTTVHIMDWIGKKLEPDNHEDYAHLQGYLVELIYNDLRNWKLKER